MQRRPPPAADLLYAAVRRAVTSKRDHALAHELPNAVFFAAPRRRHRLRLVRRPSSVAHVVVPTVGHHSGRLFQ